MVDLVMLQSASYVAASMGVLVAAIYYILNLRATLQTRQAQLFMQSFNLWLASKFDDKLTDLLFRQKWSDYDDWKEKFGPVNNPQAASNYTSVDTFFEGLGTLVRRRLIDPGLVDDLMGGDIIAYWSKMRPIAEGLRREYMSTFSENSEYLYDVVKKIYEKRQRARVGFKE